MRPEVESRVWLKQWIHSPEGWWLKYGIRGWVSQEVVYLTRYTRTGFPLESAVIDTIWCDREAARALIEGEMLVMLKKREERKVAGLEKSQLGVDEWAVLHPALWEHMSCTKWPDGTSREPSSLLVFHQDGQLKGMLRDKDQSLCLWATARTFSELLSVMEVMVSDPETEWREDRQAPGQRAKRRKPGTGQ